MISKWGNKVCCCCSRFPIVTSIHIWTMNNHESPVYTNFFPGIFSWFFSFSECLAFRKINNFLLKTLPGTNFSYYLFPFWNLRDFRPACPTRNLTSGSKFEFFSDHYSKPRVRACKPTSLHPAGWYSINVNMFNLNFFVSSWLSHTSLMCHTIAPRLKQY